jgi:hypothetical protein
MPFVYFVLSRENVYLIFAVRRPQNGILTLLQIAHLIDDSVRNDKEKKLWREAINAISNGGVQ